MGEDGNEDKGNMEDDCHHPCLGEWWWYCHTPGRGGWNLRWWRRNCESRNGRVRFGDMQSCSVDGEFEVWDGDWGREASRLAFPQVSCSPLRNGFLQYSWCMWTFQRCREYFGKGNCLTLFNLGFSKLICLPNLFFFCFVFIKHLLINWGLHFGELFSGLCRYFSIDKVEQRRSWLEGG